MGLLRRHRDRYCNRNWLSAVLMLAAGSASAQTPTDFVPLFDGTLNGWTIENSDAGNFSLRDAVLRVEAPRGWLKSERQYADFRLRIEFRFVTDDADSGLFVRAVADESFGSGWPSRSYQVQLRNPVGESRFPLVGAVFRHGMPPGDTDFDAAAATRLSTGTGLWQTLEIEVIGEQLTVKLNDAVLTRASGISNPTGYIGIQGETGALEFRVIEISESGY